MTSGYEKQRIIIMLCTPTDGTKMSPYLILNRKMVPEKEIFPKNFAVPASPKTWMIGELKNCLRQQA